MDFLMKLASIFAVLFSIFSSIFGLNRTGYAPIDADNLKMSAVLISDTHIDTKTTAEQTNLERGLKDIAASKVAANVLMINGDLTNNGLTEQYDALFTAINKKAPAKKVIAVLGNHDCWSQNYFNNFKTKYNLSTLSNITNPYYKYSVNGYTFFALGSEKGYQDSTAYQNSAYLSDEQLNWLDEQLAATFLTSDKPVFVMCHQPINGTNRQTEAWALGGLGDQSTALLNILKKYADQNHTVILSSGHLHNSLGYSGVTNQGNLYFVDVPSFGVTPERGDNRTVGTGYVVECYAGKVVLRARDFVSSEFYDKYVYTINTTEKVTPVEPTTGTPEVTTQPEVTTKPESSTTPCIYD
ncbi:MAG TPA: hypothetical protein DDY98_09530 [Ruminococcaceae bacterium]|nr:hypothetical protein [Oscillospiraceae bacterium]